MIAMTAPARTRSPVLNRTSETIPDTADTTSMISTASSCPGNLISLCTAIRRTRARSSERREVTGRDLRSLELESAKKKIPAGSATKQSDAADNRTFRAITDNQLALSASHARKRPSMAPKPTQPVSKWAMRRVGGNRPQASRASRGWSGSTYLNTNLPQIPHGLPTPSFGAMESGSAGCLGERLSFAGRATKNSGHFSK